MEEIAEINEIIEDGMNAESNYSIVEYNKKAYKIGNRSVNRFKELVLMLANKKNEEISKNFDDFTYHPKVNPISDNPIDYSVQETLDTINENIFKKVDNHNELNVSNGIVLDNGLIVKNVIDLGDSLKKWLSLDQERRMNMQKFLSYKKNFSDLNTDEDNLSLIGTTQSVAEGSVLSDINNKSKYMIDNKCELPVIGSRYIYIDDKNICRVVQFIVNNPDKLNDKIEEEKEFKNTHDNAIMTDVYVNTSDGYKVVPVDCLIISNNMIKKGV